jgi:DNA-binding CsgD family transcriptional regulator
LFLRGGFSITILAYACVLLYFNNFFNYTSFLFVLFAIYATPKLQPYAVLLYALAVFIVFALKGYAILTLGIHGLNCVLFYVCARYLFAANPQTTLLLTDDERLVLRELAEGKMQKQIGAFSPNKVTKVIKNAMERNSCKTKAELLHRFIKENPPAAKPEK